MPTLQGVESYRLSESDYRKLCTIIYDTAGIFLRDSKRESVHSRLNKILRKRGIESFSAYLTILRADASGDELTGLLDAISTEVVLL